MRIAIVVEEGKETKVMVDQTKGDVIVRDVINNMITGIIKAGEINDMNIDDLITLLKWEKARREALDEARG